jgi:PTH2 family peptidyl-tRNA hydrolase
MNNSIVKQVIIIRSDLGMSPGKIAAQVSHASLGSVLNSMKKSEIEDYINGEKNYYYELQFKKGEIWDYWLNGVFTKITLKVESEEELLDLYNQVKDTNIPHSLITDAGFTEIESGSKTCLAIGPYFNDDIDKITGKLKLYR